MRIAEGKDVKIGVFDIETYVELFDIGIYDPDTGEWKEFEISAFRNDLYEFAKYYQSYQFDYWVSFNGIGFDHPVLQYIIDNYQDWADLSNLEITRKISEFGSKIIEDQKFEILPIYKEHHFPVKVIDLFRIHHFDNKARRTSLKWTEFMMNMDVEEMPIHFGTTGLTPKDIQEIKDYRKHDVLATYQFLLLTLGITDLPELKDYKGKNKIQDRFDVMTETGMQCLNWSDVKIGEEWNKLDYKIREGLSDDNPLFDRKIKQPYGQPFKKFFPSTMRFETDQLKDFIKMLGDQKVKMNRKGTPKQEYQITIGKTTYTIAKGGLHSTEKHRTIIPPAGWNYDDIDVGSQYPNSIVKLNIYAPHLKPSMMELFKEKIKNRFLFKDKANELKKQGRDDEARPYSSVQEMLKLCLNGGYYGKLGQEGSFLQYPEGLLKVCMGNQIEILMLIEKMEVAGFQVLSGNTDGITVLYPSDKKDKFLQICSEWENQVGNHTMGKLEHTPFKSVWQESINHYIAKKDDGKVKKKGRFATEFEINKNKSKRIIPMAIEKYFIEGINPIEFITNHKNIYDFCEGVKAWGDLHYEEIVSEEKTIIHKKLVRYYICNEGSILMKRGTDLEGNMMNNHCEATDKDFPWMGQPLVKYFNRAFPVKDFSEYNINYSYYILETLKRIDKIQKTKIAKTYADQFKHTQLSLFG